MALYLMYRSKTMLKSRRRTARRLSSDINVTPLADISLSLLLGFLVITPIIIETLSAVVPGSGVGVPTGRVKQDVVVVLTSEANILVNGKETPEEELSAKLEEIFPPGSDVERKVMFTGAGEVEYDRVIHLLDLLKEHGIEVIGIR